MKTSFVVMTMLLLVFGVSVQAELLVNGNFEDGATGQINNGVPGWNTWGDSGWHNDDAGAVIDTKSMKFWWDACGMWQDFAVTPGVAYNISAMVIDASRDTTPNNWNYRIDAEFYDAANVQLLATPAGLFDSTLQPNDTWVKVGSTIVAPAGAVTGRVYMQLRDWESGIGGALYFDNVSVTPEPATMLLLGLGGLLIRRKQA
jgi:hypothetical protein